MECIYSRYARAYLCQGFVETLSERIGTETDDDPENRPLITFFGANDFHHVALGLIRRFHQPFNMVRSRDIPVILKGNIRQSPGLL